MIYKLQPIGQGCSGKAKGNSPQRTQLTLRQTIKERKEVYVKRKKSHKSDLGDIEKLFWQEWSTIQDQLYRCCLKLMNFNPTIAEDALSRAMLHSWEKVQNYVGKIGNLKRAIALLTSPQGKKRSPLKSCFLRKNKQGASL